MFLELDTHQPQSLQLLELQRLKNAHGENFRVVSVIGDGSMTGGLAFEAMNNAGHLKTPMIVILNDNEMSISPNVGALNTYLTKIVTKPSL